MDFNEKLALELIKKHNLPRRYMANWKQKGKIPEKYTSTVTDEDIGKLLEAMSNVNARKVCKEAGASYRHFTAVADGIIRMKDSQYHKLKEYLKNMVSDI